MNDSREEQSHPKNALETELSRLRTFWYFYILSPVVYLIIALIIDHYVFDPKGSRGFVTLSDSMYRYLLLMLGALGVSAQILILRLKPWFARRVREAFEDSFLLRRRLTTHTLILAGICDVVAILGLLLFILRGDIRTVFVFGLLSLIYYAQVYPSKPRIRCV
jgi:hypothetical protein